MRCITCRTGVYNIKTKKTLKMYVIVRTELSMNENTKKPQTEAMLNPLGMSENMLNNIKAFNSHNSLTNNK